MIFKNLFTPKYRHPDPEVRIEAIAKLHSEVPEQKSQLHELAFNDDDVRVSIAALERLNSFALWCKMAQTANQDRLRNKAQKVVEQILFDDTPIQITLEEKFTFISECSNNVLLEKALMQPWFKQAGPDIVMPVLNKLDKDNFTRQYFFDCQNSDLQLLLLEEIDDQNFLNKVCKKCTDKEVVDKARLKLEAIANKKSLATETEHQCKLVLSQLLALKDSNSSYPELKQAYSQYIQQFEQLQQHCGVLPTALRAQFVEKFNDIKAKLTTHLQTSAEQWQASEKERLRKNRLEHLQRNVETLTSEVSSVLSKDASLITLGQVETFEQGIEKLFAEIALINAESSTLSSKQHALLKEMTVRITTCKTMLSRLPEFQQAISQAKAGIAALQQTQTPESFAELSDHKAFLSEQRANWRAISQPFQEFWPATLESRWRELIESWQNKLKTLEAEAKKEVGRVSGKLRTIENMVQQGKFRAAIGIFEKTHKTFAALTEEQKKSLKRKFDGVKQQIEELQEWQQYIAKPRKPEALKEVQSLLDNPLPISEQAQRVKALRAQWKSFGDLGDEEDKALNEKFDSLIEQAFKPCREHYEALSLQRQQNLQQKQAVLAQLVNLADELNLESVDKQYRALQKQWKQIGEVDFNVISELNEQYRKATQPIKLQLKQWQADNAEAKNKLIQKAEKLLESEDVVEAVEQAKALQKMWRESAKSSPQQEQKLWNAFRKINDEIFSKRKYLQNETQQAQNALTAQLDTLLAKITETLSSASSWEETAPVESLLDQAREVISKLSEKPAAKYRKKLHNIEQKRSEMQQRFQEQKQEQALQQLFSVLQSWTQDALPEEVEKLSGKWQQWFNEKGRTDSSIVVNREQLTIEMELLSNVDSPIECEAMRKDIQLRLMADKLQDGQTPSKMTLLKRWVQAGPLTETDQQLLARMKPLF